MNLNLSELLIIGVSMSGVPINEPVLFYGYNYVGDPKELYGNVSWVADSFLEFLDGLAIADRSR